MELKRNTFGGWLKWQRNRRGWKQRHIEMLAGVDHSQYSRWENDHIKPEPDNRQRFHVLYETSDDDLVKLGILERQEGIDGAPFYVWAEHITPSDRAVYAARDTQPSTYEAFDTRGRLIALIDSARLTTDQLAALTTILDGFRAQNGIED